jgi:signal peptidase I
VERFRAEMTPDPLILPSDGSDWRAFLVDTLQTIALSLLLFFAINLLTARIRVDSVSMRETLFPGDFVLVNKMAYRFGELGRGDIVVFDPPVPSTEPYIKRVIGLPGDVITMRNGQVFINNELLSESYIASDTRTNGEWHVPDDSFFVMGDNRNNSSDSRAWGTVPLENIIGEAVFIYWPPPQWGALVPSAIAAEVP